jgi:hypothetical protein
MSEKIKTLEKTPAESKKRKDTEPKNGGDLNEQIDIVMERNIKKLLDEWEKKLEESLKKGSINEEEKNKWENEMEIIMKNHGLSVEEYISGNYNKELLEGVNKYCKDIENLLVILELDLAGKTDDKQPAATTEDPAREQPEFKNGADQSEEILGFVKVYKEGRIRKISESRLTDSEKNNVIHLYLLWGDENKKIIDSLPRRKAGEIEETRENANEEIKKAWDEYKEKIKKEEFIGPHSYDTSRGRLKTAKELAMEKVGVKPEVRKIKKEEKNDDEMDLRTPEGRKKFKADYEKFNEDEKNTFESDYEKIAYKIDRELAKDEERRAGLQEEIIELEKEVEKKREIYATKECHTRGLISKIKEKFASVGLASENIDTVAAAEDDYRATFNTLLSSQLEEIKLRNLSMKEMKERMVWHVKFSRHREKLKLSSAMSLAQAKEREAKEMKREERKQKVERFMTWAKGKNWKALSQNVLRKFAITLTSASLVLAASGTFEKENDINLSGGSSQNKISSEPPVPEAIVVPGESKEKKELPEVSTGENVLVPENAEKATSNIAIGKEGKARTFTGALGKYLEENPELIAKYQAENKGRKFTSDQIAYRLYREYLKKHPNPLNKSLDLVFSGEEIKLNPETLEVVNFGTDKGFIVRTIKQIAGSHENWLNNKDLPVEKISGEVKDKVAELSQECSKSWGQDFEARNGEKLKEWIARITRLAIEKK